MGKVVEVIVGIYKWVRGNEVNLINVVAYLCLGASAIVKITPTLKDDNKFKPIIKFIGKYIALNKYGPEGQE